MSEEQQRPIEQRMWKQKKEEFLGSCWPSHGLWCLFSKNRGAPEGLCAEGDVWSHCPEHPGAPQRRRKHMKERRGNGRKRMQAWCKARLSQSERNSQKALIHMGLRRQPWSSPWTHNSNLVSLYQHNPLASGYSGYTRACLCVRCPCHVRRVLHSPSFLSCPCNLYTSLKRLPLSNR